MSEQRPNNSDQPSREPARDPEHGLVHGNAVPRELRGIARLLDARGARERNRLGDDAIERIFAASDLQRPLGLDPVSPVVGRITPVGSGSRPLLRMAAAIAALAGIGAVIAVALSLRGGAAPAGTELVDGSQESPTVAPESPAPSAAADADAMLAVEHFDTALEGSIAAVTASRPAGAVIVALADRGAGALAGFAGSDGAMTDELEPLFATGALLDGSDLTYDDLSQELASVVQRASMRR